jgi:glucosamine--fructose-6-phosphate aminotransferase (isomerizing)
LVFVPSDESRPGVEEIVTALHAQHAAVLAVGGAGDDRLKMIECHKLLLPLAQIQALYRMVDRLAALRGHDADAPPHLAKVTETL